MRIIKQGVAPETVPIRATCGHCKTEVEFLPAEATYHPAMDQRDSGFYEVQCPTCRRPINGYRPAGYSGPG